jgi:hypothetical protein
VTTAVATIRPRFASACVLLALAARAALAQSPADPPATAPATTAQFPPPSDEQVVAAMRRGADFLLASRNGDNWESGRRWTRNGQHGGETALALYALLHAGQSLKDDPVYGPKLSYRSPDLAMAVDWLCNLRAIETYTVALQANALALLPQPAPGDDAPAGRGPRPALQRARQYLLAAMGPQGGYTYGEPTFRPAVTPGAFSPIGDLSNAQYAALGMWALEDAGLPAPPAYWQTTDRFWRLLQKPSGSWPYWPTASRGNDEARDSMGLAGLATLLIAQEFVDKTPRLLPKPDRPLDLSLAWLNQNFTPDFGDLYSMYTIERIGLAGGYKYFGPHDWYKSLAANILAHQRPDGSWDETSWPATYKDFNGASPTTCTAYALLFLARGRNPVLFNKLQYTGGDATWDSRPRDAAFLTRFLSKRFERPMNWQIVNLQVDGADWLDAPILLITGARDPQFTLPDIEKIRAFVDGGGTVFSTADGGSQPFTNAIRTYAGQVAKGRYEMRVLPKEHPFYSPDLGATLAGAPPLMGMSNGVREFWIHSPTDLGASWQTQRTENKSHFEIPTALYFYATGEGALRSRLNPLASAPPSPSPATRPAAPGLDPAPAKFRLPLARLLYGGNADPEPGAWPRLARRLHAAAGIDVPVTPVSMQELDPAIYPVAHMTGTARFLIKDADAAALKHYLDAGGLLIADAAGGSDAFADSFRQFAATLYPDAKFTPLPPDHPVYTGRIPSPPAAALPDPSPAGTVTFRKYGVLSLGHPVDQATLDVLSVNGRPRIVLSPYDITSGLLGTTTWGIVGYAPDSAERLAGNLLRWAAVLPPATAPAAPNVTDNK